MIMILLIQETNVIIEPQSIVPGFLELVLGLLNWQRFSLPDHKELVTRLRVSVENVLKSWKSFLKGSSTLIQNLVAGRSDLFQL